jgi:prepilin-type N-terminal cleavage/methylation domain-containing protein
MKLEITMNKEHGFTLIELITAMVIVSIILATAIPNFSGWRTNSQIRAESNRVHMDLLLARMTAMKSGRNIVVTFVPGSNSYSILHDNNSNGTADTGESLSTRVLENHVQFGFSGPNITDMDGNTGITETVKMGPSDIVTFDPRGQADLSGVLFLIHSDDASSSNDRLRGISIVQATGSAELWKYNASLTPIPWE